MLRLKACPRCNGNVMLDKDLYGWYEQCLQCGYLRDMETMIAVERETTESKREGEPTRAR